MEGLEALLEEYNQQSIEIQKINAEGDGSCCCECPCEHMDDENDCCCCCPCCSCDEDEGSCCPCCPVDSEEPDCCRLPLRINKIKNLLIIYSNILIKML